MVVAITKTPTQQKKEGKEKEKTFMPLLQIWLNFVLFNYLKMTIF